MITETDLILNADSSVYHLHLRPEHLADTIITVGDPERVSEISQHFDTVEHRIANREFVTHVGTHKGKRLMVISTGIGTDNVDIVLNELDALANIDFATRTVKPELRQLTFIRVGTSGGLRTDIDVDSLVVSDKAIGFDNLMQFYDVPADTHAFTLADTLTDYMEQRMPDLLVIPYGFSANRDLLKIFENAGFITGNTVTLPGFYAPQGRILRGGLAEPRYLQNLANFKHRNEYITNFEMETAGIYGLAHLLGHRAISVSVILANRSTEKFSENPQAAINSLIAKTLDIIQKMD